MAVRVLGHLALDLRPQLGRDAGLVRLGNLGGFGADRGALPDLRGKAVARPRNAAEVVEHAHRSTPPRIGSSNNVVSWIRSMPLIDLCRPGSDPRTNVVGWIR